MSTRRLPARTGAVALASFFGFAALLRGAASDPPPQDDTVADGLVDQADPEKVIRASSRPGPGDLITSGDTLWVDTEARRVGINKGSADTNLHVYGNFRVWSNHKLTDNLAQGAIQMCDITYSSGWSADPTGFQSYGGALELNPRGLNPVEVNNALRVMPNGFVGLGVDNPAVPFDMQGAFRTNDTIVSTKAAGAPFQVASTDLSVNLNADLLDGFHADAFSRLGDTIEGSEIAPETISGVHIAPDARIPGGAIKGTFPQAVEFLGDVRIGGTLTFGDGSEIDSASGLAGGSSSSSSGPIGFQETLAAGAIAVAGADVGHHESLLADLYVEDTNARVSVVGLAGEGGGASLLLSRSAAGQSSGSTAGTDPLTGGSVGGIDPFGGATGLLPPAPTTASAFGGAWSIEHRATGSTYTPLDVRHSQTDALDGPTLLSLDPEGALELNGAEPNATRIDRNTVALLGGRLRLDPDRAEVEVDDEIRLDARDVIIDGDLSLQRAVDAAGDLTVGGAFRVSDALDVGSTKTAVLNDLELAQGDFLMETGDLALTVGSASLGGSLSVGNNAVVGNSVKAFKVESEFMSSTTLEAIQGQINLLVAFSLVTASSRAFKQDIEDIGDARALARRMRGVRYRERVRRAPDREPEERRTIGLVAEEVAEVLPEVVHFEDEKPAGIEYGKLTALLLEVVKEQDDEIVAQRTRIDDLEAKLAALDARLAALEDE